MKPSRALGLCLLAGAAVFTTFFNSPLRAQAAGATHEVRKGDTLFAVARKARYDSVTRNQMLIALYRANQQVFPGGDPNRLEIGSVLAIPPRELVEKIDAAEATRLVSELIARQFAAVPPAGARPVPGVEAAIKPVPPRVAPLGRAEAARRYRAGLALERGGDDKGALQAFLEAGESGYGLAQRRLGEIYDKGNSVVQRDYETALKWYQKAREQGIEIPKPFVRSPR